MYLGLKYLTGKIKVHKKLIIVITVFNQIDSFSKLHLKNAVKIIDSEVVTLRKCNFFFLFIEYNVYKSTKKKITIRVIFMKCQVNTNTVYTQFL